MLPDYDEGQVILIDKPLEWTSAAVVTKVKEATRAKTGHAGTLDPLASGLLICCTGKWTKKISGYQGQEKEYIGTFTLGATTASYDREYPPENIMPVDPAVADRLPEVAARFTGKILQVPPGYSAIKKNGTRAYELVRSGRTVVLEARPVTIRFFEMKMEDFPILSFRVICSTGTYIRSLAHDVGAELGCGAYLSKLVRTRIGEFMLKDAQTPAEFAAWVAQQRV